jgi:hypothetical protein
VTNNGPGTARGVKITDPLPGGTVGTVTWSLDSQSPAGSCSISGAAGSQSVTCGPQDLASGNSITFHVSATTSLANCGIYNNTATFTTTNDGSGPASATEACRLPTLIAPTNTTCSQFASGTAPSLVGGLTYGVSGTQINNVAPGVFFYFASITVTGGPGTVTVQQTRTGSGAGVIPTNNDQAFLYNPSCTVLGTFSENTTTGVLTLTNVANGTYIIGVKYQPSRLKDDPLPSPATITYSFQPFLGTTSLTGAATVSLHR